jgi:hypothetical protein
VDIDAGTLLLGPRSIEVQGLHLAELLAGGNLA